MQPQQKKQLPQKLREQMKKEREAIYHPYIELPAPTEDPHAAERAMFDEILDGAMRAPPKPAAAAPPHAGDLVAQMAARLRTLETSARRPRACIPAVASGARRGRGGRGAGAAVFVAATRGADGHRTRGADDDREERLVGVGPRSSRGRIAATPRGRDVEIPRADGRSTAADDREEEPDGVGPRSSLGNDAAGARRGDSERR